MEANVAYVAMAADDQGGPGMRETIATVPAEYGTSKGWRFNDCRATPGGAIFAGRFAAASTPIPCMPKLCGSSVARPVQASPWLEPQHWTKNPLLRQC